MTRLSNRQFPMLEQMATGVYLSVAEAQHYDQRPFRSMLLRGWIGYQTGRGFHITRKGRQAYDEFHHTSIERKNPLRPLTAYFNPADYGLALPAKRRVIELKRRGAA